MDLAHLLNEMKCYQLYIGKAIAQIYINEKICDFHDNWQQQFNTYATSFSEISSALLLSQRMIFCDIFIQDRDSKNIHKLLNRLISTKISTNKSIDLQIKEAANQLKSEIDLQQSNIEKLKDYRNKIMAHFSTKFFINEWRMNFPIQNDCKFMDIAELAEKMFDGLSKIIILLNDKPLDTLIMTPLDFDYAILKLLK